MAYNRAAFLNATKKIPSEPSESSKSGAQAAKSQQTANMPGSYGLPDKVSEEQSAKFVSEYQQKFEAAKKALDDYNLKNPVQYTKNYDGSQYESYDKERDRLSTAVGAAQADLDRAKDTATLNRRMNQLAALPQNAQQAVQTIIRTELEAQIADSGELSNDLPFMMNEAYRRTVESSEARKLLKSYGLDDETIRGLVEASRRSQNAQSAQEVQEGISAISKNKWGAVPAWMLARGMNLTAGIAGTTGVVQEMINRLRGSEYSNLDPNNPMYTAGRIAGAVTQAQTEDMGAVGKITYQGLTGIADNLLRVYAGFGTSLGSSSLAAMSSFQDAVQSASERGASPKQALLMGTINGGLELITEHMGYDKLLGNDKPKDVSTFKKLIRAAASQAGSEILEEETSFLGNLLADAAVMAEKSEYQQKLNDMIANGTPYDEARAELFKELCWEAAETAITSGISGFGMSAVNDTPSYIRSLEQQADMGIDRIQTGRIFEPEEYALGKQTPRQERQPANVPEYTPISDDARMQAAERSRQATQNAVAYNAGEQLNDTLQRIERNGGKASNSMADYVRRDGAMLDQLIASVPEGTITNRNDRNQIKNALNILYDNVSENTNALYIDNGDSEQPEQAGNVKIGSAKAEFGQTGTLSKETIRNILNDTEAVADLTSSTGMEIPTKPSRRNEAVRSMVESLFRNGDGNSEAVRTPEQAAEAFNNVIAENVRNSQTGSVPQEAVADTAADSSQNGSEKSPRKGSFRYNRESPLNAAQQGVFDAANSIGDKSYTQETADQQETDQVKDYSTGKNTRQINREYSELGEEYGTQRERQGSVRRTTMPVKDASGNNISEAAANVQTSYATPKNNLTAIKELTISGELSDAVQTNAETVSKAKDSIIKDGSPAEALTAVRNVADRGKSSPEDAAKAAILYQYYTNQMEETKKAGADVAYLDAKNNMMDAFVTLTKLARNGARSVQIFSIFRKMNPDIQIETFQRSVESEIAFMEKRGQVRGSTDFQYSDADIDVLREAYQKLQDAKDDTEKVNEAKAAIDEAEQAVYAHVAAQLHTSLKGMWNSWRYMSMLGNVKTIGRNTGSNFLFRPFKAVQRNVNAALQSVFISDRNQRTAGFVGLSKGDFALKEFAKADRGNKIVQDALKASGKMGDVQKSGVADYMKSFDFGGHFKGMETALNNINKGVDWMLQNEHFGDTAFKNWEYASAFTSIAKARGITAEMLNSGQVSENVLQELRSYAVHEALVATFNDTNAVSDALAMLRSDGDNAFANVLSAAAEGVIPFRKTPANVAVRIEEYSPLGIFNTAYKLCANIGSQKYSASSVLSSFASTLTGSAAFGIGFLLAKGIGPLRLRGGNVDDDEKRQGMQEYAVEIGDNSFTLDWASPAMVPLFMGANLCESLGENPDVGFLTKVLTSFGEAFEPMLQMSMLSSLNDLANTVRSTPNEQVVYAVMANLATSYFMQGFPTLARHFYNATTPNKTESYVNTADQTERNFKRTVAGIPFLGALTGLRKESVDEWGRTKSNGNTVSRFIDAYFSLGSYSKIQRNELEDTITRLNSELDFSVSPRDAAEKVTFKSTDGTEYKDYRYTKSEYDTAERVTGQTSMNIAAELVDNDVFSSLSSVDQGKLLNDVYDYAAEIGKREALKDKGYPIDEKSWISKAYSDNPEKAAQAILNRRLQEISGYGDSVYQEAVKKGFDVYEMQDMHNVESSFNSAFKDMRSAFTSGKTVDTKSLQDAYKELNNLDSDQREFVLSNLSGTADHYVNARQNGISDSAFAELYRNYYSIGKELDENGKELTGSAKAVHWSAYLDGAVSDGLISRSQRDFIFDEMGFYTQIKQEAKTYNEKLYPALNDEKLALAYANAIAKLEPDGDSSSIKLYQKLGAVLRTNRKSATEQQREAAVRSLLSTEQNAKLDVFIKQGMNVYDFVVAMELKTKAKSQKMNDIIASLCSGKYAFSQAEAQWIYRVFKNKQSTAPDEDGDEE